MWSQLKFTNEGPGARAAHSCDLIGNNLYVFGGWNGNKALNDLYVLDFAKMSWTLRDLTGNGPSSRNNHSIAMVGIKLFIHGGHDGMQWLSDLYTLDTDSGRWDLPSISGEPPSARACHTLTRVGHKLYMFGGFDGTKCFNDIDILDLDTMTWIRPAIGGKLPKARNAHTMTCVGKKVFLFGGHSGNKHLQDLHILDTIHMQWDSPNIAGVPPPGLRGHTSNVIGNKIYVFGGYDGRGRSNDLHILNLESSQWEHVHMNKTISDKKDSAPPGRQRHTACLVGSQKLYIFGGFDGFKWRDDMHVLDVGKLQEREITSNATSNLLSNMKRLLNNSELFSDVTFIVEGKPLFAHRAILAAQCDQFHAMFCSGMRESQEKAEIIIPNWSHSAFRSMLEFLYTGAVDHFTPNVAVDLLGLADQYTLESLKSLCENVLIHNVDSDNCCMLFRCSHRFQAHHLKKFAMDYIINHFENVSTSGGFEELSNEPQLLLEVTRESMSRAKRRHK
jgi:N-acetylneuraminic acid mutarotase